MRKTFIVTMFLLIISSFSCTQDLIEKSKATPPIAEKEPKELKIHDQSRIDNYYWLNQRENPEVTKYLKAENSYLDTIMSHTNEFQEKLFNEIVGRIVQDDESVPYKDNGYYYYSKFEEGMEHPVYCRKKDNLEADEEIMLDVNILAEGHDYYQVTGLSVSPNNQLLTFGVDTLSRRKHDIFVKDLNTNKIYNENISNTTGKTVWANDNKTILYELLDETLRPYKIMKHQFGNNSNNDSEVYREKDPTFICFTNKSKSKKFIVIGCYQTISNEYYLLNADQPDDDLILFNPREKNLEYTIYHFKNKFYIRTNWNAKNFKLMETPIDKTSKENWVDVIPHRENVLLEEVENFNNFLVIQERENGVIKMRIINRNDESEHYVNFEEEAYSAWISDNTELNTEVLRYEYSSLTTPRSTYDYNLNTKEKILLKQDSVKGNFKPSDYHSERVYAESEDGVKIPISIVYKKGIKKDGKNPLLLYSYGSYGSSQYPYFSSVRLSILDRGFIYAIAHVRGGEDLGRDWYENGKLLKKKNTFYDFISCGKYLINQNFTNKDIMFAEGGSAGGLLVGAVSNMAPDLFKGIIAAVPFVDVVTTMLDETIPLTTSEYDEWGNPNEKEYYDYMLSYSPYDNVETKNYPALLVTTGIHDSQVQYWEPAKWVAKLRDMKTDNNILLLKTSFESGHGGKTGRFARYRETAFQYAFLFDQLNIYK